MNSIQKVFPNRRSVLWLVLSVLLMGLIFYFSHQPAVISDASSNAIIDRLQSLIGWLDPHIQVLIVRKGAHFTIYAALGFCLFLWLEAAGQKPSHALFWALAGAALYAATDEFHQLFVTGRSGQISDVFLDACGALCGIALAWGLLSLIRRLCEDRRG